MKVKFLSIHLQLNRVSGVNIYSAHVRVRTANGNWSYGPNLFIGTPHKPTENWEAQACAKQALMKRGLLVEQFEFITS